MPHSLRKRHTHCRDHATPLTLCHPHEAMPHPLRTWYKHWVHAISTEYMQLTLMACHTNWGHATHSHTQRNHSTPTEPMPHPPKLCHTQWGHVIPNEGNATPREAMSHQMMQSHTQRGNGANASPTRPCPTHLGPGTPTDAMQHLLRQCHTLRRWHTQWGHATATEVNLHPQRPFNTLSVHATHTVVIPHPRRPTPHHPTHPPHTPHLRPSLTHVILTEAMPHPPRP